MPSCQQIDALITPYIDGELADADRRAVQEHLRRCPPCYSREAAERAVRDLCRDRRAAMTATHAPESLHAACARIARGGAVAGRQSPVGSRQASIALASWRSRLTPYALAASL